MTNVIPYVIRNGAVAEVMSPLHDPSPRKGNSVAMAMLAYEQAIDAGATEDDARSAIAANWGVYLAILPLPGAGQVRRHGAAMAGVSTGHDTEITINGEFTYGYSFLPTPPSASLSEITTAMDVIAAGRLDEGRRNALQQLAVELALANADAARTPIPIDTFVAEGMSWYLTPSYASSSSEHAERAAYFSHAQSLGLIP